MPRKSVKSRRKIGESTKNFTKISVLHGVCGESEVFGPPIFTSRSVLFGGCGLDSPIFHLFSAPASGATKVGTFQEFCMFLSYLPRFAKFSGKIGDFTHF